MIRKVLSRLGETYGISGGGKQNMKLFFKTNRNSVVLSDKMIDRQADIQIYVHREREVLAIE